MGGPFLIPQQIFDCGNLTPVLSTTPTQSNSPAQVNIINSATQNVYGNYVEITPALPFNVIAFLLISASNAGAAENFELNLSQGAAGFEVPFISNLYFDNTSSLPHLQICLRFKLNAGARIAFQSRNLTGIQVRTLRTQVIFLG